MYLSQERISKENAESLYLFLKMTRDVPEKRVFKLILGACGLDDAALERFLEGILQQCIYHIDSKQIKIQYLKSFIYSNNSMGVKSMEKLNKLIPNLFELVLNNIQFNGGTLNGYLFTASDMI